VAGVEDTRPIYVKLTPCVSPKQFLHTLFTHGKILESTHSQNTCLVSCKSMYKLKKNI